MSAAENKKLAQNIFAEMARGNPKPLIDLMDDKFRWRISGNSKWSKTFEGKQAVITGLFGLLGAKFGNRPRIAGQRFIAEDDLVVVEARGNNVSKTGAPYNNSYCFVLRFANGKLQEIIEYMDTDLALTALGAPPES